MTATTKTLAGVAASVAALTLLSAASGASAQFSVSITVDENGNGVLTDTNGFHSTLPFALQTDTGPGGLAGVLTYDMLNPPGMVAGDVLLQDGVGGPILDLIRFNPDETIGNDTGALLFYSDNTDGFDSIGDTAGPPVAFYTNTITILEVGPEGSNGAFYTPTAGEPGFVAGAAGPVEYHFISDGSAAPEPAAWALMLAGFAGLGAALRARRTRPAAV